MQVIRDDRNTRDLDFRNQRNSSPESLLERLEHWFVPTRFPEVGLLSETDDSRVRNFPSRQCGLSVVSRTGVRTLRQLDKLTTEDIVQSQLSGDLLSDVQTLSSSGIDVDFLKKENIRV